MGVCLVKKKLSIAVIVLFLSTSIIPGVVSDAPTNRIIYVDDVPGSGPDNPPEDFTSIKDAVNASSSGDTIFIFNGIYYEKRIEIYKSLKLKGENRSKTIIYGDGSGRGIMLFSSNYTMSNITLENYGSGLFNNGFIVGGTVNDPKYCENIEISNCIFEKNADVKFMISCNNVIIRNCNLINNKNGGISAQNMSNFKIINCVIENCGTSENNEGGIIIGPIGSNISIEHCYFRNNYNFGIAIHSGLKINDVLIKNNIIEGLELGEKCQGIYLWNVNSGKIQNNLIINISGYGVYDSGIYIQDCNLINVTYNDIEKNKGKGIFLMRSSDNNINSNNFIDNYIDVYFRDSDNIWDGNYWGRLRLFPKIIFGFKGNSFIIPNSFDIDWHPAKEPYDIPAGGA